MCEKKIECFSDLHIAISSSSAGVCISIMSKYYFISMASHGCVRNVETLSCSGYRSESQIFRMTVQTVLFNEAVNQ